MNRIRELRLRAGLSVARLAEKVGTTRQQIDRLEKGQRKLTEAWMQRLAPHLGCDPADLMARPGGLAEPQAALRRGSRPADRGEPADPARLFGYLLARLDALYIDERIRITTYDLGTLAHQLFAEIEQFAADDQARPSIDEMIARQRRYIRAQRDELLRRGGA